MADKQTLTVVLTQVVLILKVHNQVVNQIHIQQLNLTLLTEVLLTEVTEAADTETVTTIGVAAEAAAQAETEVSHMVVQETVMVVLV